MQNFAEEIRKFIVDNFLFGDKRAKLGDSDSLLEKGIIDSTGVLELVTHIEQTYKIKVEDEDLVPANLDSINNLVKFLERKLSTAAEPAPKEAVGKV